MISNTIFYIFELFFLLLIKIYLKKHKTITDIYYKKKIDTRNLLNKK